jgi:WD40 repeat protein
LIWRQLVQRGLNSVAFSIDGQMLATGGDGSVTIRNVVNGGINNILMTGLERAVQWTAFSPDGNLVAGVDDFNVFIWDIQSGSLMQTIPTGTYQMRSVAFSPDSKTLGGGGYYWEGDQTIGVVKIWEVYTGQLTHTFTINKSKYDEVRSITFSPDGTTLVAGGQSIVESRQTGEVWFWDLETGEHLQTLSKNALVTSVAFSPNLYYFAIASGNFVTIWQIK